MAVGTVFLCVTIRIRLKASFVVDFKREYFNDDKNKSSSRAKHPQRHYFQYLKNPLTWYKMQHSEKKLDSNTLVQGAPPILVPKILGKKCFIYRYLQLSNTSQQTLRHKLSLTESTNPGEQHNNVHVVNDNFQTPKLVFFTFDIFFYKTVNSISAAHLLEYCDE